MHSFRRNCIYKIVILLSFELISSFTFAADINYNIDISLTKFDNISLVANPTAQEWTESITGQLNIVENTANFVGNLSASIKAQNYRYDQQQDTTISSLNSNGLWIVTPNHFEWFISDIYSQKIIDPSLNDVESNRKNVNAFLTGPNYHWRLNSRNHVNFEARIKKVSFEDAIGDNERLSSSIDWEYLVSPTITTSINSELEKIAYNNVGNDYVRSDFFARFNYKRAKNTFIIEAGISNIGYDQKGNISGQRYRLAAQNQRNRNSNIRLDYTRKITDTGAELFAVNIPIDTPSTNLSTDVYINENLNLNYNKTLNSGLLYVNLSKFERRYTNLVSFNQHGLTGLVRTVYNFSTLSKFTFEAKQTNTVFENVLPIRDDNDYRYKINYSYKIKKNISLYLGMENIVRESTDLLKKYKDNRVTFSIKYSSI